MAVDFSSLVSANNDPDAFRRKIAAMLLSNGIDASPIQSPWQGASRLANALVASVMLNDADKQEREALAGKANLYGLGGSSPFVAPQATPSTPSEPANTNPQLLSAVPLNEQSGSIQPNVQSSIDRSSFKPQFDAHPELVSRLANMVNGEVGLGRDPKLETIQTESALNRAQARGIPLAQALLSVSDDPKLGYYASSTYNRPASQDQVAYFKDKILPNVLSGSDLGTQMLGSPVTGNGSQLGFAGKRADQGMYDAYKWYSGVPGQGEMFVTEKGDAARAANLPRQQAFQVPQQAFAPQQQMPPVNVASLDPTIGVSAPNQPPGGPQLAQNTFVPGPLPDVQNLNVRPNQQTAQTVQPPVPANAQQPASSYQSMLQNELGRAQAAYNAALKSNNTQAMKDALAYGAAIHAKMMEPPKLEAKTVGDRLFTYDPRTGKAIDSTPSGFKPDTPEIRQYNLYAEQTKAAGQAPLPFEQYQIELARAKSPQNNISVNSVANPILEGISKQFIETRDKANSAIDSIRVAHELRKQVDSGMFTGTFANWQTNAVKLADAIGLPVGADEISKMANSEAFMSTAARNVMAKIKSLGSGSGISDADREYAAKAVGGQITLNEQSMRRILDINEKLDRFLIDKNNKMADKILSSEYGKQLGPASALLKVDEPPTYEDWMRSQQPQQFQQPQLNPNAQPVPAMPPPQGRRTRRYNPATGRMEDVQ